LIYAEGISSEEGALQLLATHICDENLGEGLLGNKQALHSDILKEGTAKLLPNISTR